LLGFTRAAQADTALLPLEVGPPAHQARAHVIQLGQLDLQLALVSTRALGEDIQDQPGTIQHAALEHALEVALLAGREGVVEDDQLGLFGLHQIAQLFDLATADQELGGGHVPRHGDQSHHVGTRRQRQILKLLRIFGRLGVAAFQMNKDGPFTTAVTLEEQVRLLSGVARLDLFALGRTRQAHWTARHHSGNGVFVDHLADCVLQQNHELVEGFNLALQLDAVDQIDGNRYAFLTQGIQVRVL
jgi:hypothetical protein